MPAGRPSEYEPRYCELLIKHMEDPRGSFESFAAEIGHSKQSLYNWLEKFPEFMDARKEGEALSLRAWLNEGYKGMWAGKQFNAVVWIFNMRNRFGWRDDPKEPEHIEHREVKTHSIAEVVEIVKAARGAS